MLGRYPCAKVNNRKELKNATQILSSFAIDPIIKRRTEYRTSLHEKNSGKIKRSMTRGQDAVHAVTRVIDASGRAKERGIVGHSPQVALTQSHRAEGTWASDRCFEFYAIVYIAVYL